MFLTIVAYIAFIYTSLTLVSAVIGRFTMNPLEKMLTTYDWSKILTILLIWVVSGNHIFG